MVSRSRNADGFQQYATPANDGRVVLTDRSGEVELIYESLENIPESIKAGSEVERGETLGSVGCSYRMEAKDPEHVHIELRVWGEYKNPMDYFEDETSQ